jgi:hypothetical protein
VPQTISGRSFIPEDSEEDGVFAELMNKRRVADPIPKEFASYEAAAKFWDQHDTTDYPNAFRTVKATTRFRCRYYEIEIEEDVVKALKARARRKKVPVGRLASKLLRQQLASQA